MTTIVDEGVSLEYTLMQVSTFEDWDNRDNAIPMPGYWVIDDSNEFITRATVRSVNGKIRVTLHETIEATTSMLFQRFAHIVFKSDRSLDKLLIANHKGDLELVLREGLQGINLESLKID